MTWLSKVAALALAGSLAVACGTTPGDRAITGGGLGAAAGVAGAAIVGGSLGVGALIGGAAGVATGALTGPEDIYLGQPVWE
ncbi:MAG: hypothetical protein H6843_15390 [Rhodospirillaceae bacterium]|nr:hypothetical protein [Rhodospirillaceae bacterium]